MIEVRQIKKAFNDEEVLRDVSFKLRENETLSVLGASGSGKSTLLKIIAGLLDGYSGTILVNGKAIDDVKPKNRGTVYIYQQPLLFPHLNVEQNIAFGLTIRDRENSFIQEETGRMIAELQLQGQEHKYPHQLSGGQQQRVSFGRAFIIRPEMLLLDEPFASLDPSTRRDMQILFKEIAQKEGITSLFVTHDLKEALITGDRFGMMSAGKLRVFDDKESFIKDSESGVQEEIQFWKEIQNH
jgi:ABC-type Fe3+/spermidine/putrescine transport system ATPase subunit